MIFRILILLIMYSSNFLFSQEKMEKIIIKNLEKPFSNVNISSFGGITLMQGDSYKVIIEMEDQFKDLVKKKVKDNTLYLSLKNHDHKEVNSKAIIYTPQLSSVILDASGGLLLKDFHNQEKINIKTQSTGSLVVQNINCKRLDIRIDASGSFLIEGDKKIKKINAIINAVGNVTFNQKIGNLDLKLNSSNIAKITSKIDSAKMYLATTNFLNAEEAIIKELDLDAHLVRDVKVFVKESLKINSSKVQKIEVDGNPKILSKKVDKQTEFKLL